MIPRILGLDLSDELSTLVYYGQDISLRYPTIVAKDRNSNNWFIGEKAYEKALDGTGLMSLNLLSMTLKDTYMTVEGEKFLGKDLLRIFISLLIEKSLQKYGGTYPEKVVVSLRLMKEDLIKKIREIFLDLGYLNDNILIISKEESFIYYIMSQNRDVWNNQVALFDLSDKNFVYYELQTIRMGREIVVCADSKKMEESIKIDLLKTQSGAKLADRILTESAKKLMQKKLFSAIALTGKGFEDISWASEFTKYIANRKKVFYDASIFAKGASIKGLELVKEEYKFKFVCICEGHIDTSVYLELMDKNTPSLFELAKIGQLWHKIDKKVTVLLDHTNEVEFVLVSNLKRKKKSVKILVDFFKDRPKNSKKVDIFINFRDNRTMQITICDAGFGEFFPKTESKIIKEVDLWE